MYAGLRRGELMGLRSCDIDLARGVIEVHQAWTKGASDGRSEVRGRQQTCADRRSAQSVLAPAQLAAPASSDVLVFGTNASPFYASSVSQRAGRTWKAAGLRPICLHDCRHTFASLMIASGVNAKGLSTGALGRAPAVTLR